MFTCPMHPEVLRKKMGRCSKCGMKLVSKNELKIKKPEVEETGLGSNYRPLVIVVSLILITSLTITLREFSFFNLISNFMIGFFLTFSGFKLIDIDGFAAGYSTYDLLAKRVFAYGYVYPFIELSFGLLMILFPEYRPLLIAEILIMSFSGVGVLIKILKKEKFQCVCLGTFLKVPLTYVTLIEDFGMAVLALIMLIY